MQFYQLHPHPKIKNKDTDNDNDNDKYWYDNNNKHNNSNSNDNDTEPIDVQFCVVVLRCDHGIALIPAGYYFFVEEQEGVRICSANLSPTTQKT